MTKPKTIQPITRQALTLVCGALACFVSSGCIALPWSGPRDKAANNLIGPVDSMVLRGEGLERDRILLDDAMRQDLEGARRLFQDKEYAKAEPLFAKVGKNKKTPIPVLEEAIFYEAECQFLQENYRDASATYKKLIRNYVHGQHSRQANERLMFIADLWLEDTRKQIEEFMEKKEGKRYFVLPASYFHFSKDRPFYDQEGNALVILDDIWLSDMGGPLGEKALFKIATVKFFREDYKDADFYYAKVYETYPNGTLAPKAIKQSIICKQIMNGGTAYDGRPVEESRKLIDTATRAYPQIANKDQEWLQRQLASVNFQNADRDFRIAEFYRRTGHPGSAYFYYELVRRRYPGTDYAEKAVARMSEVRGAVEREQQSGDGVLSLTPLQRLFNPRPNPQDFVPQPLPVDMNQVQPVQHK